MWYTIKYTKYYNGRTRIRGKKGGVPLIDTVVKRLKVNTKKEILEATRGKKKRLIMYKRTPTSLS